MHPNRDKLQLVGTVQTGPATRQVVSRGVMIRVAMASDIPAVKALMQSVPGMWHDAWPPDVLERAFSASGGLTLVHDNGDAIDGFACAHDLGFRAYLSALVVAPASQRCGIGSLLLTEIERRLASRGCSTLIADVWRDAVPFYRRLGWIMPTAVLVRKRLDETDAGRSTSNSSAAPPPRD